MRKLLIWATDIPAVISGEGAVGGINVQLFFWAKIFKRNGWAVSSFTKDKECELDGIHFYHRVTIKYLGSILEWLAAAKFVFRLRPDIVVSRGASRAVFPLSLICNLLGVRYVLFGASDVNFVPGQEITVTGINRKFYQWSVPRVRYFVAQNSYQQMTLKRYYKKGSVVISNIWGESVGAKFQEPSSDVIWVANFRRLKRAEWVLEAAKKMPDMTFVIIGGPIDEDYYAEIEEASSKLRNVSFLGRRSFRFCNDAVAKSRVLLCSSVFEGFPNTFLQAWSNTIPVISTVDPSDIIKTNNLGRIVGDIDEFIGAIKELLNNPDVYSECKNSIANYFEANHSPSGGYEKLIGYLSKDDDHTSSARK